MKDKHRTQLQQFESELDLDLASLKINALDANESLALVSNLDEFLAAKPGGFYDDWVRRAIAILGPKLVSGTSGPSPVMEDVLSGLRFASHYFMLRDYLYYTYNAPDSMRWVLKRNFVEIRFRDRSIPRQFFTAHNEMLLGSFEAFSEFERSEEILGLLKGEPEGVNTPNTEAAFTLMAEEVNVKLSAYFSILPMDSPVDLGGYRYADFIAFYRSLLIKAMYHRYMARANGAIGAVFIGDSELIEAARADNGLEESVVEAILSDIVFDDRAAAAKVDASYFSLFREGSGRRRIVMRPHEFSINEGIIKVLRLTAVRRPRVFLSNVSNDLGSFFVRRVKAAWEAQGFSTYAEVSLRKFDPTLPDIDLLVICEEPTLGFVLFVCEVKSPIPPTWAKDQLKVLGTGSVSKAFRQAEAVQIFLRTADGVSFLRSLLPPEGLPHFDGFVVSVNSLVITSDNAGMFFEQELTPVVSFRTLERLLRRSDGDTAFIQHVLRTYNREADRLVKFGMAEFQVGGRRVRYQAVTSSPILDFPQQNWRNSPERRSMIEEFIASGAHPFDSLPTDPRKLKP